ncbi:MAG: glycosyltransferase [Actinomycetota bacterium]
MDPALTIVVPARNESARLPKTFGRLVACLDKFPAAELLISIDPGSTDDTATVVRELSAIDQRVRYVTASATGKGAVLRTGIEDARGDIVLMADADLSVDPDQFDQLIDAARGGSVAIASRSVTGARRLDEPKSRYLAGRAFNSLVRWLLLPGIRDSQCGFKAFPRVAGVSVLREVSVTGWAFDVEFLARARRAGMSIREFPVTWTFEHGSTVRMFGDAVGVGRDIWRLRRRLGRRP